MKGAPRRARVWRMPIVLGLLSAIGLIAALLADGAGDVLSWVALAIPVAAAVWYGLVGRRQ